jgi:hypothetical protein
MAGRVGRVSASLPVFVICGSEELQGCHQPRRPLSPLFLSTSLTPVIILFPAPIYPVSDTTVPYICMLTETKFFERPERQETVYSISPQDFVTKDSHILGHVFSVFGYKESQSKGINSGLVLTWLNDSSDGSPALIRTVTNLGPASSCANSREAHYLI